MNKKTIKLTVAGFVVATGLSVGVLANDISPFSTTKVEAATNNFKGFKDVKSTHWAYSNILWGVSKGILNGYPDGTFKPNSEVTEAEFMKMLIATFAKDEITTSKGKNWADPFYDYAKKKNYPFTGVRNKAITRTKVAEIVSASQGVNYVGDNAIRYMLGKGLSNGKTSQTVQGYEGSAKLTRAEAITFILNLKNKGVSDLKEKPTQPSDPSKLPNVPDKPEKPSQGLVLTPQKVVDSALPTLKENGFTNVRGTKDSMQVYDKNGDQVSFENLGYITIFASKDDNKALKSVIGLAKAAGFTVNDEFISNIKNAKMGFGLKAKVNGYTAYFSKGNNGNSIDITIFMDYPEK
ncbi:S-layer homology domain-containing protein [Heyndrickxia oleronia]|uniref:S-layer homology domain-containing protein n=1 Tax=Heyndrickxia oleronia TaxID=38875 RepID=A0AAW6T2J7_9BACI|nr:S-layer homology domain-containing protein [Heyndrickxia oleronia]MCM3457436.1 S-layer homology domain-containing protein [Heyndrickxia oleronia]MDH5164540.1 S-layer homology domain-containing protein [Heyndrickxia oleronia]NYV68906.1 S-layer homology domain-containing protein [Bacillus sp. Gen3]